MKKQIITLTVAALTLSSCGIYTQYKPATEVPDNLYGEQVAVADTVDNIGNLSWQEIFTDPRLQELIEQGLRNNTDLQSAQWRVKEAEAAMLSAKLAYLPSFALSPQGTASSFDKGKAVPQTGPAFPAGCSHHMCQAAGWNRLIIAGSHHKIIGVFQLRGSDLYSRKRKTQEQKNPGQYGNCDLIQQDGTAMNAQKTAGQRSGRQILYRPFWKMPQFLSSDLVQCRLYPADHRGTYFLNDHGSRSKDACTKQPQPGGKPEQQGKDKNNS